AEDRGVRAREGRPGDPRTVHQGTVSAGRPAPPAGAPPAAPPAAAQNGARPAPLFEFAPNMDIPAGQTGGRPLPPEQRKAPGPNDRPPVRLGPSVGGFAPGQFMRVYQEGAAMKLPAGTTLVFQMHYTTYGQATTGR